MNNSNGPLSFEATLGNQQFNSSLTAMENRTDAFTSRLASESQKWDSTFNKLGVTIGSAFAFSKATQFISDIVKVRGEFQQLDIAFTTMLQSKAKADQLMTELIQFAATTPFGLKETATAAKQLLAYGSTAESVQRELRMLGDVAAGVSQPIGELVYLYGTLRTQGRAYAMDIRQFAGRGIPIYAELAKVLGVSKDAVSALVSEGKVGFQEVEQAFKNMTAEGSMFGGLMDAQSKSIPGQIERLKDAWDQLLNKIGTETQPVIEGTIGTMGDLVQHFDTIGKSIIALVAVYGTYKAAVVAVNAFRAAEVLTLGQVATSLGAETLAKVDNAAITANLTAAIAAETATRAAAAQATLVQLRSEVSEAAAKKVAAIETAKAAAADVAAAEAKLANALAAQRAATIYTTSAAQEKLAKDVAIAQNELLVASEAGIIARKEASAAASEFNAARIAVETGARNASTLSNAANTATTVANTAAVNAGAIANTRLTALQQLRLIVTKKLDAATNLLNKTMLGNPYVLLATVIVGVVAATWAFADASTAAEAAQKRLNDILEAAKKRKEELSDETSRLVSTVRNETESIYAQIKAYEELQKKFPELFAKMTIQEFQAKDLTVIQKQLNTAMANMEVKDISKEYEEALAVLKTLEKHIKEGTFRVGSQDLERQQKLVEGLRVQVEENNKALAKAAELERVNNLPIAERIAHYKQIQRELEIQRDALSNSLLLADKTGQSFNGWQKYIDGIRLNNLNDKLKETLNLIASLTGQTVVHDKDFFEKAQKAAKDAFEKIPVDQLGSPQAKQLRKDYEAATKELEKYSLTEKKAKKPKKEDIVLPAGSLGEIDRQIKKAEEALNKIPEDQIERIKAMHATLLQLTEQRVEAAKVIEFRNWQETLDYKRKLYAEYESAIQDGYAESAKKQFESLRSEGENYIQFLKNQIAPLEAALYGGGKLSDVEFSRLVTLTNELNTAMGVTTPMEKFKERLDQTKESAANIADYVASLKEELTSLNAVSENERDATWYAQFKDIKERLKSANQDAVNQLKQFLQQVKGSEEQRLAIVKKYADLRAKAQGMSAILAVDKAERKELKDLAFETSAEFANMNEVIVGSGRKAIVEYIKKLEELYKKAVEVYGATSNEAKNALNQLNAEKNNLQDFDSQNWVNFANVIGQAGSEMAEMEGFLGSIGSLLAGATQGAQSFAQNLAYANKVSKGGGSTGESVAAIGSGVGSLLGMFINSRKKKKAERKQRELDAISFQVEMNKALNEEIRLRTILSENVFFKDYAGRIKDAIGAATDALSKYNQAVINLAVNGKALEGTKNSIDWGNVLAGVGTGAGTGAAIGATIGGPTAPLAAAIGAVIGAVVGGVVGLISTATKSLYGPLLEKYPQLIDANGMLNKSLAETLISTNQVDDQTKLWLQDLINASDAMEEARKQITDIVSDLTSNIGSELRDALVDAFESGEDAAYQFSKTVEKTLENALSNLIYSAIFSKAFSQLQKNLEDSLLGSGRSFADVFAEFLGQSQDLTKTFNDAMKAAQEEAKKFGFDLFGSDGSGGVNSASQGIANSITEETGSLIAGQINAMRTNQAASLNVLRLHTAQFEIMIHYQSYLVNIDRRLSKLNNEPWRALGMGENPED